MPLVALVLLVTAGATTLALQPRFAGTSLPWLVLGAAHAGLAGIAIHRMWRDGTLAERLTPRGGDFSIGVVVAVALLVGSWILRGQLVPPGSPTAGWLARIYLVLGDPNVIQRSALLTAAVLLLAGMEELSWRGLAQDLLETRLGPRWGWLSTAALYAVATLPSVVLLSDPVAGPNPLLVVAAIGGGLTWGFLTRTVNRLWPAMFSHMAFLYFTAVQFRVPGITPDGL